MNRPVPRADRLRGTPVSEAGGGAQARGPVVATPVSEAGGGAQPRSGEAGGGGGAEGGRGERRGALRTAAALVAVTLALALPAAASSRQTAAPPGATAPSTADAVVEDDWRALFARAARASHTVAYTGETLWVTWSDGVPRVWRAQVSNTPGGELTMTASGRYTVRFDTDGPGGLVDHRQGWRMPLPSARSTTTGAQLARLARKYRVVRAGTDHLLDRPATRLELVRRADGSLRERLWFDKASGLLLRRETYDDAGDDLRLTSYLSLDLGHDGGGPQVAGEATRALGERDQGVERVEPPELEALRAAGWVAPVELPGRYGLAGAYAVSSQRGQPLQLLYSDGVYALSLYQQRGALDEGALPPGAAPVPELGWRVWEWPDAVPRRLVWEADGTTFSLVGDAPPADVRALLAALPRPQAPSPLERLRRGASRLWSWMSPWG